MLTVTLASACGESRRGDVIVSDAIEDEDGAAGSCGPGAALCPAPGLDASATVCTSLSFDRDNCGACGNACPRDSYCHDGTCISGCEKPGRTCGDRCTDLQIDRENCGDCGHRCGPGEACSRGLCIALCVSPAAVCGGTCVDVMQDPANCGACGTRCQPDEICADGACLQTCRAGTSRCGRSCFDFQNDPRHCGSCDTICPSATCAGGICGCTQGTHCGDSICHDVAIEIDNCGACDTPCAEGAACTAGACACPAGSIACGLACLDTTSDARNCGACGIECLPGQSCVAGACTVVSAWRLASADEARTRWNRVETGRPPGTLAWSTDPGPAFAEEAIESGGTVVVYRTSFAVPHGLEAFDLTDGRSRWFYATGASSIAYAFDEGDVLFAIGSRFNLARIDGATGVERWRFPMPVSTLEGVSVVTAAGTTFAGGFAAYERDGTERFGGTFTGGPIAVFGNHLYAGATDILSVNSRDGAHVTVLSLPGRLWSGLSFDGAHGYAADVYGAELVQFDPRSGAVAWRATGTSGGLTSVVALGPGEVYWVADGQLRAIDPGTGAARWTFAGDSMLEFAPAGAAGYLYVASRSRVFAVDLATHASVWEASPGGRISIAAGRLLVSGIDGILRVYVLTP